MHMDIMQHNIFSISMVQFLLIRNVFGFINGKQLINKFNHSLIIYFSYLETCKWSKSMNIPSFLKRFLTKYGFHWRLGPTKILKTNLQNHQIRIGNWRIFALFAGSTDTWRPAIGLFFNFFFLEKKKNLKDPLPIIIV